MLQLALSAAATGRAALATRASARFDACPLPRCFSSHGQLREAAGGGTVVKSGQVKSSQVPSRHVAGTATVATCSSVQCLAQKHAANARNSPRLDQAVDTRLAVACSTAQKGCGALASRGS